MSSRSCRPSAVALSFLILIGAPYPGARPAAAGAHRSAASSVLPQVAREAAEAAVRLVPRTRTGTDRHASGTQRPFAGKLRHATSPRAKEKPQVTWVILRSFQRAA
ncbi:hypothetical protein FDZ84_13735 [Saccharopolyspora sp. ASAGF58]|nr:hypothetical protein FDZ84_13735 [Saccharopolyspora sp. ASAGF58]